MKKFTLIFTVILVSMAYHLLAQENNEEGKRVELQFRERASFLAVDDKYSIVPGVIYYADDGFRVFSGYDVDKCGTEDEYVILTYQDWKLRIRRNNDTEVYQPNLKAARMKFISSEIESIDKELKNLKTLDKDSADIRGISKKTMIENLNQQKALLYQLSEQQELVQQEAVHMPILAKNGVRLAMLKTDFDRMRASGTLVDVYSLKCKYRFSLASGFMTIPFKLRPKRDSVNFNITTDITLGAYIGGKMRLTRTGHYFLVLPATLGLSYINVGNHQTSNVNTEGSSNVVPGWTWSTGLIFDLNRFNVGVVLGQDFASGVGEHWLYNKKIWFSFSIGYSFFNESKKN